MLIRNIKQILKSSFKLNLIKRFSKLSKYVTTLTNRAYQRNILLHFLTEKS